MGLSPKFLKAYKFLCASTLALIALGGAVRAMNAGLACPDWPLCFGDVIPDYHPQVYFEFIHRVLAGAVALGVVGLNIFILTRKGVSAVTRRLCYFSFLLLATQIVMGGLTVLLQLHDKIVTAHLALGTGLLGTLLWIYFSVKSLSASPRGFEDSNDANANSLGLYVYSVATAALVYLQILIGGQVASNYAALACTDFPLCFGKFIPTLQGNIGLHVIHRLVAYAVAINTIVFWWVVRKNLNSQKIARVAGWMAILVLMQVGVGIANVLFYTPPLITVLHLTMAATILGFSLRAVYLIGEKMQVPVVKKARGISADPATIH